ncbi:MAG TPA: hypothetical protein VIV60_16055, partial [Polyangiaceae bacterium]
HEAGNYDNRSCNSTGCHTDMIGGGWVYASAKGLPWVGSATITITNSDGSIVTSTSGEDGFFQITSKVIPPYKVCVSKCPGVDCNLTPHPNADCQTSNCHGSPTQRVYVSGNAGGASSSGGASSMGGGTQNCTPPASGGPYTHSEFVFGNQPCSGSGCHRAPKPVFKGGFLYEGPDSTKTVADATVTLTQSNGTVTTAVTGPDGMFFFGTVGPTSVGKDYGAPYTACVSKCPLKVCSANNEHTNSDDCVTCHDGSTTGKIYLK